MAQNNKTEKLVKGLFAGLLGTAMTGCSSDQADLPPKPDTEECSDWDWDSEEGVYSCDERNSHYYGHFWYGGFFYGSRNALHSSSAYNKYKSSPSFKGGSTGFGSGRKGGFGG
ncbi:hypothetical protein [Peribacillus deserti]|uniref:Aminotransferase yhxA n=1 Tax=Peribacillus deserti TaxID=673318 RepID=A0A2N5M728_9BACI|nr:hypothetical protein [Peribacillus deserti]PLT30169.1 hypothetical protein CUU66_09005 [Peribacillus deserti]